MATSTTARATRFVLRELVGELLYWPVWWYTRGTASAWTRCIETMTSTAARLSLRILFVNLGRPMYADYTRSGRVISFVFRIGILIVRSLVWIVVAIFSFIAFLLWLVGPVMAGALLIRQVIPL